jgi:uncharacterized membrane protein YfcA
MELLLISLILFVSSLIRTAFGFGAGLTAMPLLLLLISIKVAAPVVAVMSMTIALFIIIRDRQAISYKEAWKMILFAVLGVPIGLFLMKEEYKSLISITLGIIVTLFAIFKLYQTSGNEVKFTSLKRYSSFQDDRFAPIFCLVSGILGGAYNVNGPPVVIYATMRQWNSKKLRAMMQAIFLPLNITIIIGHILAGNFSNTTIYFLTRGALPIGLGIILGTYLHSKIKSDKFIKIIYILLIAIGINLIVKNLI